MQTIVIMQRYQVSCTDNTRKLDLAHMINAFHLQIAAQHISQAPTRTAEEPGVLVFRLLVVLYALCLPGYLYYRFAFTIEGAYQTLVCVLESYGALNVLLLGIIRFPRPWASAVPEPPEPEGPVDGAALISGDGSAHGPFDVAILVPCCNEPDDVVFGTLRAALALSHPLAWRVRVVLCDDGGKPARAERLRTLGPPERILYVSRPNDPNVPRHGKAGNLNYALREVVYRCGAPSADALVVVFDCDMEAHGDFLAATLPYLAIDARTALVQTPQFFYNVVPQVGLRAH